jgi:flagellar FliJ protein
MAPKNSFAMLQQLAEQRRDGWTRKLGTCLAQAQESKNRLQLLVDYRVDYQGRLERAVRGGIKGEGLRNYQSFLANLERAIEQQSRTLAGLQDEVLRLRAEIANEQRQIESYVVLQRRRARSENQRENRRQQSLQDEIATNSVIRLNAHRDGGDD